MKICYFSNKIEGHKDNPKKVWDYFKPLGYSHKSKGKSNIVLEINNEKWFDNMLVAEPFNNYYINVA